jgi:hypothetical protein
MFPKKGKFFPDRARRPGTEISYEAVISEALNEELRDVRRTTIKTVMEWTGASERTVKNWLAGKSGPSGSYLICILRHSEKVLTAVLRLSGREHVVIGAEIVEARNRLFETIRRIDEILNARR